MEKCLSGLSIRIEQDTCIGSGSCTRVAPEVFQLNSMRKVEFVAEPQDIEPDRLVEACEVCPVGALFAHRGDEQLAP